MIRQQGLVREVGVDLSNEADGLPVVRVRVSRCRPGFIHPIGRREIADALAFFGPLVSYGLRSIELRQSGGEGLGSLALARLLVPGRIVLYEQPEPPWEIRGVLSSGSRDLLERAGAMVIGGPSVTRIEWPGDTLAGLMLFDGLMHEIGHHLIQQNTGKRTARVMRTADHERSAERFANACRRAWGEHELRR